MVKSKLQVTNIEEAEYDRWNQFVDTASTGSIYSNTNYLDVLCGATGGKFRVLGVFQGNELIAGVALYEESRLYGRFIAGRLLLYYNGIVVKDLASQSPPRRHSKNLQIFHALANKFGNLPYGRMVFRNRHGIEDVRPFIAHGWKAWPSYSYVVGLSDMAEAWRRMDQNQRRLVNRCRDSDIKFVSDDDFESFYRMHFETHQRKGAPLYLSRMAFRHYFERLRSKNLCRLFLARSNSEQPLAAQLVLLGSHPVTHTVCAAADASTLNLGTTPFLRWCVFEELASSGYKGNDLTDAALNEVTRFKNELGGDLVCNLVLKRRDTILCACGANAVPAAKAVLRPIWRLIKGRLHREE